MLRIEVLLSGHTEKHISALSVLVHQGCLIIKIAISFQFDIQCEKCSRNNYNIIARLD